MKKYVTSILLLLLAQQFFATTFYDQLCQFNFNWKKYKEQAPKGEARNFYSDKEFVQAHLSSVLTILRAKSVNQLNTEQVNSRKQLIEMLNEYRLAGNFPLNYYRTNRIPVFIDRNKTHCAVAYLLEQTGHEDIALRIASADNYAWVKDIHEPELVKWQESSGLSLEELKLIQGAYDSYMPHAFTLPNKYEIPQKPSLITAYFENELTGKPLAKKTENIWLYGEGVNGVLNGKWIQNFAVGMPWIVGYYENGKRTGQWKEYYQGTKQICRTENWRNNKLNGKRKRFDMDGNLIEEILFKDGNAITKTNFNLNDSLIWVRKPLDSINIWTEVFTYGGAMIASGHEKINNPGNLLWFQNIELTALNSISISARSISNELNNNNVLPSFHLQNLYGTPPLVQYKKEGEWMYYNGEKSFDKMREKNYSHFGNDLSQSFNLFNAVKATAGFDSIRVVYTNDKLQNFFGYEHLKDNQQSICYYNPAYQVLKSIRLDTEIVGIKEFGRYKGTN